MSRSLTRSPSHTGARGDRPRRLPHRRLRLVSEETPADPAATAASGRRAGGQGRHGRLGLGPEWPEVTKIAKPVDLTGKKFTYVALGDQIPVIHGVGVGVQEALAAAGAEVKICDGKFNPTAVADCLKAAGDEQVDGVISAVRRLPDGRSRLRRPRREGRQGHRRWRRSLGWPAGRRQPGLLRQHRARLRPARGDVAGCDR